MTGTILGALSLTGSAPVHAAVETPEAQAALAEAIKDTKAEQDLKQAESKFAEELREDAARK